METELSTKFLKKILSAHDIEYEENGDWLCPNSTLPAIRATWFPKASKNSGVLQIDVCIEKDLIVNECFAGIGTDDIGLKDAMQNFSVNSLHVLLSAFWDKHDAQQVDIETWTINDDEFKVYIGPYGNRAANAEHPGIPDDAFEKIESQIKSSGLDHKYNWFRTYFCNIDDNKKVYEALYNNETWDQGEKALKSISWPQSDHFFSTRNFIVVIKNI